MYKCDKDNSSFLLMKKQNTIQSKQNLSPLTIFKRLGERTLTTKSDESESPNSLNHNGKQAQSSTNDQIYLMRKKTLLESLSNANLNSRSDFIHLDMGSPHLKSKHYQISPHQHHEDNILQLNARIKSTKLEKDKLQEQNQEINLQLDKLSKLYFSKQEEAEKLAISVNKFIKERGDYICFIESLQNSNNRLQFDYDILSREYKQTVEQINNEHDIKLSKIQTNIDILQDLQIKQLKEKINQLNLEQSKVTTDHSDLLHQIKLLKSQNDEELINKNKGLVEQLQRAHIIINELQCRVFNAKNNEIESLDPKVSSFDSGDTIHLSNDTDVTPKDSPKPTTNNQRSLNSLSSALSFDKRKAMSNFNKMTTATVEMMSNIMDYSSLGNAQLKAEQTLKSARIDLSELVIKTTKSTSIEATLDVFELS